MTAAAGDGGSWHRPPPAAAATPSSPSCPPATLLPIQAQALAGVDGVVTKSLFLKVPAPAARALAWLAAGCAGLFLSWIAAAAAVPAGPCGWQAHAAPVLA